MKFNRYFIISYVTTVFILIFSFYWHSYRLTSITKKCWDDAELSTFGEITQVMSFESSNAIFTDENYKLWERAYRTCMIHNGFNE